MIFESTEHIVKEIYDASGDNPRSAYVLRSPDGVWYVLAWFSGSPDVIWVEDPWKGREVAERWIFAGRVDG